LGNPAFDVAIFVPPDCPQALSGRAASQWRHGAAAISTRTVSGRQSWIAGDFHDLLARMTGKSAIPAWRQAGLILVLLVAGCEQGSRISDSEDGGLPIRRNVLPEEVKYYAGDPCMRRERGGWHRSIGQCTEMMPAREYAGVLIMGFEERGFFEGETTIPDRNDDRRFTTELEIGEDQVKRLLGYELRGPLSHAIALRFVGRRTRNPIGIDCEGSRYHVFVPERVLNVRDLGPIESGDPPPKPGERPPYKPFKPSGEGGAIGRMERETLERCG
jgi:hypothetical protein